MVTRVYLLVHSLLVLASAAAFDASAYERTKTLMQGYTIHWTVNSTHLRLAAQVATTKWAGFGLAESGGMPGADIVTFDVSGGTTTAVDRHATGYEMPIEDCEQDWVVLSGEETDGVTTVELVRLLDTGDDQDRVLEDNGSDVPQRVVAAWGSSSSFSYHGNSQRVATAVNFFHDTPHDPLAGIRDDSSVMALELLNDNYAIPAIKTKYHAHCFALDEAIDNVHAIGMEAVIDPNTASNVHHLVISGFSDTACHNDYSTIWVWVRGQGPWVTPAETGARLGGTGGGYRSINVQTHFDNPSFSDDLVDNSGVRVFYTATLRQYDAGVFHFGDPTSALAGQGIPVGKSRFTFHCPSSCTTQSVSHNITVFNVLLHMHDFGKKMSHVQSRDGAVVRNDTVQFYDAGFQASVPVGSTRYTIRAGDEFATTCWYDTGSDAVEWGIGSEDEMCIAFISYYPRLAGRAPFCGYHLGCGGVDNEAGVSVSAIPRELMDDHECPVEDGNSDAGSDAGSDDDTDDDLNDGSDSDSDSVASLSMALCLLLAVVVMLL